MCFRLTLSGLLILSLAFMLSPFLGSSSLRTEVTRYSHGHQQQGQGQSSFVGPCRSWAYRPTAGSTSLNFLDSSGSPLFVPSTYSSKFSLLSHHPASPGSTSSLPYARTTFAGPERLSSEHFRAHHNIPEPEVTRWAPLMTPPAAYHNGHGAGMASLQPHYAYSRSEYVTPDGSCAYQHHQLQQRPIKMEGADPLQEEERKQDARIWMETMTEDQRMTQDAAGLQCRHYQHLRHHYNHRQGTGRGICMHMSCGGDLTPSWGDGKIFRGPKFLK